MLRLLTQLRIEGSAVELLHEPIQLIIGQWVGEGYIVGVGGVTMGIVDGVERRIRAREALRMIVILIVMVELEGGGKRR